MPAHTAEPELSGPVKVNVAIKAGYCCLGSQPVPLKVEHELATKSQVTGAATTCSAISRANIQANQINALHLFMRHSLGTR